MTSSLMRLTTIHNDNRRSSSSIITIERNKNRRLLILALVAVSLAVLLQLMPTTECTLVKADISDDLKRTTQVQAKEEEEYEDDDDDDGIKPTDRADKDSENKLSKSKEDKTEEEGDDEEGESRSASSPEVKDNTVSAGDVNENSDIEKGTQTELPKDDGFSTAAPADSPKKDGIIHHSENPKAKAQEVDTTTTAKPTTTTTAKSISTSKSKGKTTSKGPTKSTKVVKIDDDEEAESRSATDALRRILGGGDSDSAAVGGSRAATNQIATPTKASTSTLPPKESSTSVGPTKPTNGTTSTSSTPLPSHSPEQTATKANHDHDGKPSPVKVPSSEDVIKELEKSEGEKNKNLTEKIEKLADQSKELENDDKKNTTITINGRKFDQLDSVECVDDKFYELLLHDLSLIDVNTRRDFYGTYYDYEYAKAVQAIVDTPTLKKKNTKKANNRALISLQPISSNSTTNSSGTGLPAAHKDNSTGFSAPDEPQLDMKNIDVLADVRKFWNETYVTYTSMKGRLDKGRVPLSMPGLLGKKANQAARRRRQASQETTTRQTIQASAVSNYQYLLRRLEELKVMMLNGEEALIVMNNRVKKLNQAVGEPDLQRALCSCITSRSGRAAFSMMNELFVDKNSEKLIKNLERAKRRGQDAALDTAEFCAYWYGDTIRSQAVQKEKQIKKLVLSIVRERTQQKIEMEFRNSLPSSSGNTTTTTTTTTAPGKYTARLNKTEVVEEDQVIFRNGTEYHEIKTHIVTKIMEMTTLWLPRLANWIKQTLNSTGSANTKPEVIAKLIRKQEFSGNKSAPVDVKSVEAALKKTATRKRRQLDEQQQQKFEQEDSFMVSTPFDAPTNYADLDDPTDLESSSILQSYIANNYMPRFMLPQLRRLRRDSPPTKSTSTSARPSSSSSSRAPATSKLPITGSSAAPSTTTTVEPTKAKQTATKAEPQPQPPPPPIKLDKDKVGDFESRIAERTSKCAVDGFAQLLKIGFDQNALMYETNSIKPDEAYIVTLRETFASSFAQAWAQKRDAWSKHLAGNSSSSSSPSNQQQTASSRSSMVEPDHLHDGRTIDEEIDNSFESSASSYDRGARLGFTVGKFIGDKAARQWPDPAELNTFTYDSLFLAGVGYGHNEEKSRELERHIVEETAKRVAFTEANRLAFATSIRSAYLNGAFVVPLYGILHAQRSVAKRAAEEAGKVGFEAASKAAETFSPKAIKFFEMHQHQRSLAAPYKQSKRLSDKWAGLMEQIKTVQIESELGRNLSKIAIDCGQKSATLMGALVGLLVTPEAFETYTRFRGSLEALESEFNQYKLGAMRGYELGESWAYLNYTNELNQNLQAMKTHMKGPEGSSRAASIDEASQTKANNNNSNSSIGKKEQKSKNKEKATKVVAAKVAQNQASQLAKESSASSLFESDDQLAARSKEANTNNIFQYMVLNYGSHLVANHSRKHMLKLRSLYIDDDLLRDLKLQTGDLIADQHNSSSNQHHDNKEQPENGKDSRIEELFDTTGNYIGELKGAFNSQKVKRTVPIKFNILDLGPLLEFVDDDNNNIDKGESKSSSDSAEPNKVVLQQDDELKLRPLSVALSKVGKVFMKFSVARKKKKHHLNMATSSSDAVSLYLNSDKFDEGDGYMCGTFSQLPIGGPTKKPNQGGDPSTTPPSSAGILVDDDLSLEAMLLDELFERIERAPESMGTVELTENVMGMTTFAPSRVESIKDPQKSPSTTTFSPTTAFTSSTASPSTEKPSNKQTKPTGSSRSAKISPSWLKKDEENPDNETRRGDKVTTTTTTTESPQSVDETTTDLKVNETKTETEEDGESSQFW